MEVLQLKSALNYLFTDKLYRMGIVAQFFYVGAQICVWSFTIRYVMAELGVDESDASSYYIAALIVFTIFRFINTVLMRFFKPEHLLMTSSILGVGSTLLVITGGGMAGVVALIAISAFMSLMFPTIFGIASKNLGDFTKIGSSGLIMAIGGGAALPALQGYLSDVTGSIHLSFAVPLVCFLVVALYGYVSKRQADLPSLK
mgnify:FL=1